MDQEQLKQKIAEYFVKLPKEAQEVFSSMTWLETLKNISSKYNLNDGQMEVLGTETTLVLLGIVHTEEYQEILEKELNLPKETLEKIMGEIDENILKTVKSQLDEVFKSNTMSLAEEKYGGERKLDEHFASLPKEVQEAINESGYQVALYEIAKNYKLTIEQMGILEEVTTKVMLNIIHPDKYEEELASKITIPREDIANLVKDVNEKILKTIREILKEHWDKSKQQEDKLEDIPIPPYVTSSKQEVVSSKDENEIPKQPEVIPAPEQPKSFVVPKPIEINTEEQVASSKDEKEIPKNIIEEKLQGSTVSDYTVSDYSTPKISSPSSPVASEKSNPEPIPKPHDPYHEPIE
jgi:hypothetical protein